MFYRSSLYLLNTSQLPELVNHASISIKKSLFIDKVVDNYYPFLNTNARHLRSVDTEDDINYDLFVYLKRERGIEIRQNEYKEISKQLIEKRDCFHFIFTYNQKHELIDRIDPRNFSLDAFRRFKEEFSGQHQPKIAEVAMEALALLVQNYQELKDDTEVLLLILDSYKVHLQNREHLEN